MKEFYKIRNDSFYDADLYPDDLSWILERMTKITASTSLRSTARKMGISASHLSRLISGKVRPGPKLLKFLGLHEVRIYVDNSSDK